MFKPIIFFFAVAVVINAAAVPAIEPIAVVPDVQAGPIPGESGSWCYNPKGEQFWGQASAECCRPNGGNMGSDRRCYGLKGNEGSCRAFYACCIGTWNSGNHLSDQCY
ncbi:MAG: hypothetical protein J3R72DRAFT_456510 [Linnemannia gamsii]|nr:MAG: hypothetical protein J3R72DRAFT_456509 [Linnemannia gamsii]KAK3829738.1 MAG: hypothetical protein J3R72DRAFT_456510 [Linnemannia gamsii]